MFTMTDDFTNYVQSIPTCPTLSVVNSTVIHSRPTSFFVANTTASQLYYQCSCKGTENLLVLHLRLQSVVYSFVLIREK